jgi:hypothetical protein
MDCFVARLLTMTIAGLVAKKKSAGGSLQRIAISNANRSYAFIAPFTASAMISGKP